MTPKKPADGGRTSAAGIAAGYGLPAKTAAALTRMRAFPDPVADDEWDAVQVDTWMRDNRPQFWKDGVLAALQADTAAAAGHVQPPEPEPEPTEPETEVAEATAEVAEAAAGDPAAAAQAGPRASRAELAARYGKAPTTINSWAREPGFPAVDGKRRRSVAETDAWVKANRPDAWSHFTGKGAVVVIPPPEGDPKDLLNVVEYGRILGNATRGTPLEHTTILSYRQRGQIRPPDRMPGDKKQPEVFEPMWYRATINDHVRTRKGPGRHRPEPNAGS